jgi:hypothetical protein
MCTVVYLRCSAKLNYHLASPSLYYMVLMLVRPSKSAWDCTGIDNEVAYSPVSFKNKKDKEMS